MALTPKEIESYREDIISSDLSQESKDRALQLLNSPEAGPHSLDAIADLIQKDIDVDLSTIEGLHEVIAQNPEYQALIAGGEREIKEIQDDLQDSMNFIESEGNKLDALAEELDQATADARLEEVKQNLKNNQG